MLFIQMKVEFKYELDKKVQPTVETEKTSEHEFLKVKANEAVLKREAERIGYKLRLSKEADEGGVFRIMSSLCRVPLTF